MTSLLRTHLAQVYFNPAFYESGVDYLAEPALLGDNDTPVAKLRALAAIEGLLAALRSEMIQHIRRKLISLTEWSGSNGAHLLSFPEYSVPVELLTELSTLAKKYQMVVIAGTHRVPSGEQAQNTYRDLGISKIVAPLGSAIAPVLLPNGQAAVFNKLRRSKWESNLGIPTIDQHTLPIECRGIRFRLAVVPCIDSLHIDVLGKLWGDSEPPNLIVCPSLSPSTQPFAAVGELAALKEAQYLFVNSAEHGGTSVAVATNLRPYLRGPGMGQLAVPAQVEAILSCDLDPGNIHLKRGSIEGSVSCTNPFTYPIIYLENSDWFRVTCPPFLVQS